MSLAQRLIDDDKRPLIPRLQLLVGIEQLHAVHGAVRREVDVELFADADGFNFEALSCSLKYATLRRGSYVNFMVSLSGQST